MKNLNYTISITASISPEGVFRRISDVSAWWAKHFEGDSEKLDDIFTVRFGENGEGDMYKMKVSEIVPNKKIVWDVIDAYQGWHDDHTEWADTKIVWDVMPQKKGTKVSMTHVGLIPEFECFEACNQGWNYLIQKSLKMLLDTNKGMPV